MTVSVENTNSGPRDAGGHVTGLRHRRGIAGGFGIAGLLRMFFPGLPFSTPTAYVIGALVTSVMVGLASGVLPARRATRLDPVDALSSE